MSDMLARLVLLAQLESFVTVNEPIWALDIVLLQL